MARLYHYTTVFHLSEILTDGFLKTVESNISDTVDHMGPDVVWLTDERNLLGQGPANVGWAEGAGLAFGHAIDKTEVRFAVEVTDAQRWKRFARIHHADPEWLTILNRTGSNGAAHWYVVERPITRDEWVELTLRYPDGRVMDIDPHTDVEVWGDGPGPGSQISIPGVKLRGGSEDVGWRIE